MRVHFGFSFRLKNVLKFLLPFAIGFLAYFGFNIIGVLADSNFDTYYNMTYQNNEELFNQNISGTSYTTYTLYEHIKERIGNSNKQYVIIYEGESYRDDPGKLWVLISKNSTCEELWLANYGISPYATNPNLTEFRLHFEDSINNSCQFKYSPFYFFYDSSDPFNVSHNTEAMGYLNSFLSTNTAGTQTTFDFRQLLTFGVNNVSSYDITSELYVFDSNLTIVDYTSLYTSIINHSNYYAKKLSINGNPVDMPGRIIPYVEALTLGGTLNTMSAKLPYNYYSMNKSDISSFNAKLKYTTLEPIDDFLTSLTGIKYNFYGRKNNSTYYSFEPIDCSISLNRSKNYNLNQITDTYNNMTCTSDLTNYDKVYVYQYYTYDYVTVPTIYNSTLSSNVDYYSSEEYLGDLFEPLTLQNCWKLLLSSNSQVDFNMISNNMYIARANLKNEDISHISSTIVGEQIGSYRYGQSWGSYMYSDSFGTYKNNMLYLYDNVTYHESMTTYLNMFFSSPQNVIYSFPTIVNNEDTFTYYNNEGNITNGTTIQTNYGNVGGNWEYSLSIQQNINVVSEFIDSISEDMYNLHLLLQSCFDVAPGFIKSLIIVIYTLSLTYLIFKELKR